MYRKAKTFQQTPSDLLGLRNGWVCWQVDNACLYLGTYGENRLAEKDKRGKPRFANVELALGLMPAPRPIDLGAFARFAKISEG